MTETECYGLYVVRFTAQTESEAKRVIDRLVRISTSFLVVPCPDDLWDVRVKPGDEGALLEASARPTLAESADAERRRLFIHGDPFDVPEGWDGSNPLR